MADPERAVWEKIDKLSEDMTQLKVELRTIDYRTGVIEDRFDKVMIKIAESRGEAHQESLQLASSIKELSGQVSSLKDDINEAKGGIRFGKWMMGIALGVVGIASSILIKIKGG